MSRWSALFSGQTFEVGSYAVASDTPAVGHAIIAEAESALSRLGFAVHAINLDMGGSNIGFMKDVLLDWGSPSNVKRRWKNFQLAVQASGGKGARTRNQLLKSGQTQFDLMVLKMMKHTIIRRDLFKILE